MFCQTEHFESRRYVDGHDSEFRQIGFIGLGTMGEPICRNLATKSGLRVVACDRLREPLDRLSQNGVESAGGIVAVAQACDVVFMSLPSGVHVEALSRGTDGLIAVARPGQIFVDLGTSPLTLTRELGADFAARGAILVDAPVARTREAAIAGALSVMVGAEPSVFDRLKPLIACFATDISLCGPLGCGQVVKILNNMILFETVAAISEAYVVGQRAGVDTSVLFQTLTKGSADSFALRNHGMKAVLPGEFPLRAFSTEYALKDLEYALQMAADNGVAMPGAESVRKLLKTAIDDGYGELYWPVISRVIAGLQRVE